MKYISRQANLKASFASGNCVEVWVFIYTFSDSEQELDNGGMGNCCYGEDFGSNGSEAEGQCQAGEALSHFLCHSDIITQNPVESPGF